MAQTSARSSATSGDSEPTPTTSMVASQREQSSLRATATTTPTAASDASGVAWDRQAAEKAVAARQAALLSLADAASSQSDAKPSTAVGLIKESQQGFAKLDADAKTKAENAKADSTKTDKTTDDKVGASQTTASNDDTKSNVARVTALYLADSDATSSQRAA